MEDLHISCDRVDRDDLDTRYLAGTLDEALAEAFEAHYFECDRCWALVHRGAEIQSAGRDASRVADRGTEIRSAEGMTEGKADPESETGSSGRITGGRAAARARSRWRAWAWAPLAAAAVLVLWINTRAPREGAVGADTTVRGVGDSLGLSMDITGGLWRAAWSRVPSASSYQVRAFTATGDLLWDRRVTDTALTIARDSVPGAPSGRIFWQVQAFDVAGAPLARSALAEVRPDSAGR